MSSNSPRPPEEDAAAAGAEAGAPASAGLATNRQAAVAEPTSSAAPDLGALVAEGQHGAAAEAALTQGRWAEAARLFEQLWDFARACQAARAGGDLPRALRNAVAARDEATVAALIAELAVDDDGRRATAALLAQLRRHGDAAELYEAAGQLEEAAGAYQRAHRDLDAARVYQRLGADRKAGQLLERALELATEPERPALELALGRLLARRGAFAEAASALQRARAATEPELRRDATLELIGALAALGMRDGARDLLLEARRGAPADAALPADLDGFLRWWRDRPEVEPRSKEADLVGGRFRLDRLLGAGSSGRVFLATDEVSGRQVALKMFFAAEARGSAAFERFAREAKVAQALRHPNLVEVYEVSIDGGFLVMELLHGGSLAQRLAAGERLTGPQVRRLALELVEALQAAHQRGVIHRDVKSANVFFDSRGSAKLGDFGVAHLVELGHTQTGGLIGTLAYMSPEQITGAPLSVAADLYGLGVTLFEALTGRLPFLGPDFVAQHLGEPAPAPSELEPSVAPGWDEILERLLRKNPAERTASPGELRAELERLDLVGNARVAPRAATSLRMPAVEADGAATEPASAEARYRFETALGATALSTLWRAVDSVLERSVVIERFDGTDAAARRLEHVRILARAHTPFLQRALALDRLTRTAVFEAPSGAAVADVRPALGAAELVRVMKRMARGIAAVHELGGWHGGIEARTLVLDDSNVPTFLTSGLGELGPGSAADDVRAAVAVLALLAGAGPTLPEVVAAIAARAETAPPPLPTAPPADGEALYAVAEALDVVVLSALGAR